MYKITDSQNNRIIIGNNVSMTLGCTIIEKDAIGDGAIFAPNSVVVADVPPLVIVSSILAKILKYKLPNKVE